MRGVRSILYSIGKMEGKREGRDLYKDISFFVLPPPTPLTFKELFGVKREGKLKNFSQQEEREKIEGLFGGELAAGRYGRGARV